MFYSFQIDSNGFLVSKGIHYNAPPLADNVPQGHILIITNTAYPDVATSMRLDMQSGGFYKLDQYGNNIPTSFVPFGG